MIGLGTIINAAAVLIGGIFGIFLGGFLTEKLQKILVCACGLSTIFIGAKGALEKMLSDTSGSINKTLVLIASLAIGGFIGELLKLEDSTENIGKWLKKKTGSEKDKTFVEGFVNASLTICIGAMAIIGPINDAIYGDYEILIAKSILDCVIVFAMSSSLGKGAVFSVIPCVIIQGVFTAFGKLIEPLLNDVILFNLSFVGSVLIFAVGINLVFGKKIKVASFIPALVIAVIFGCFGM